MSAREEALRLAREAGLFDVEEARDLTLEFEQAITRFVVLARQRPGWVWVPREPTLGMRMAGKFDQSTTELYKAMIAAAPKPEEGPQGFNFEAADGEEGD